MKIFSNGKYFSIKFLISLGKVAENNNIYGLGF